jgi:ankyrin repeat protein
MSSKHAALWDEVQGDCDVARLQAALGGGADVKALLDGWTPLHFLSENRSVGASARAEGMGLLLHAGFDVNAVDEVRGDTGWCYRPILTEVGAIRSTRQSGWSALHLLCKNKNEDLVPCMQQLLTAKANVNLQTTVRGGGDNVESLRV